MGIIKTDSWLLEDECDPMKVCHRLVDVFTKAKPVLIYQMLQHNGMFKASNKVKKEVEQLLEEKVWEKADVIFKRIHKIWGGPNIPVYIFPMQANGLFTRNLDSKSGLAFHDKLFLFIRPGITTKELEGVFIHEYHHVCRIKKLKKNEENFTLLDRMIMEGLAEHAVNKYVGKPYLAKWTAFYSEKELNKYWEDYCKKNINLKSNQPLHDELLFGQSSYPPLLGYCMGYHLVKQAGPLTIKKSMTISSEYFLPTEKDSDIEEK